MPADSISTATRPFLFFPLGNPTTTAAGSNRQISWKNAASLDTTTKTTIRTHTRSTMRLFHHHQATTVIARRLLLSHCEIICPPPSLPPQPPPRLEEEVEEEFSLSSHSKSNHSIDCNNNNNNNNNTIVPWLKDSRETPRGEN